MRLKVELSSRTLTKQAPLEGSGQVQTQKKKIFLPLGNLSTLGILLHFFLRNRSKGGWTQTKWIISLHKHIKHISDHCTSNPFYMSQLQDNEVQIFNIYLLLVRALPLYHFYISQSWKLYLLQSTQTIDYRRKNSNRTKYTKMWQNVLHNLYQIPISFWIKNEWSPV